MILSTISENMGAAVEPPVTYSDRCESIACHNMIEATIGPFPVSKNPINEVLYFDSE